ncbi:MAG: hypothetical protein ABI955_04985, partial [Nitrospirota bacterium]
MADRMLSNLRLGLTGSKPDAQLRVELSRCVVDGELPLLSKREKVKMLVAMGVLLALWMLMTPACLWAESMALLEVGKFSVSQVGQAMPDGWKPLTFKKIPKHTSYE